MELIAAPLEGPRIAGSYRDGDESATRFFRHDPGDVDALGRKVLELDGRFDASDRRALLAALNRTGSIDPGLVDRWVDEHGLIVATGQQPGLFGGALLTLYKAATAVRLAARLEDELQRPVLPMFWIASEDHDWSEVDHCLLPDSSNDLVRIRLDVDPSLPERALRHRTLGPEVTGALDLLETALPPTDFRSRWTEVLREAYAEGQTLAQALHVVLRDWLGPAGLVVVEAADPVIKERSASILLGAIENRAPHHDLLVHRGAELKSAGWGTQVPILDGALNLFVDTPDGRQRVMEDGTNGLILRKSGEPIAIEDLTLRIEDPEVGSVSPNALLRPVVESAVFPVVASVLGPSELAYHAQIAGLFESYEIMPPFLVPRASFVAVERKTAKVLEKLDLQLEAFREPAHALQSAVAKGAMPPAVAEALGTLRSAVGKGVGALEASAKEVDPTLGGPVSSARSSIFSALEDVEKKIVQAVKRQEAVTLEQLAKARLHLRPLELPQERVISPLYFLTRYDDAFLAQVLEGADAHVDRTLPLTPLPLDDGRG